MQVANNDGTRIYVARAMKQNYFDLSRGNRRISEGLYYLSLGKWNLRRYKSKKSNLLVHVRGYMIFWRTKIHGAATQCPTKLTIYYYIYVYVDYRITYALL